MTTLAMFPGQGSQVVGMGKDLLEQFPYVGQVFEEAEDGAKFNIRKLCFEGPESDLKLTENTQPCILTVSLAYWRVLKEETSLEPEYFAGHSLGEYSALVSSSRLSLLQAAELVRSRGQYMQAAVPKGTGSMAAVLNFPAEDLEKLCGESSSDGSIVELANFNSAAQLVVAGHKEATDRLLEKLQEKGIKTVLLPVSAPFHSSLMKPARDKMAPLLADAKILPGDGKIIANYTGSIEPEYSYNFLVNQIDSPVKWLQTMELAKTEQCTRYIEVGPGKVLFGLARRILPRKEVEILVSQNIEATIKQINGAN